MCPHCLTTVSFITQLCLLWMGPKAFPYTRAHNTTPTTRTHNTQSTHTLMRNTCAHHVNSSIFSSSSTIYFILPTKNYSILSDKTHYILKILISVLTGQNRLTQEPNPIAVITAWSLWTGCEQFFCYPRLHERTNSTLEVKGRLHDIKGWINFVCDINFMAF